MKNNHQISYRMCCICLMIFLQACLANPLKKMNESSVTSHSTLTTEKNTTIENLLNDFLTDKSIIEETPMYCHTSDWIHTPPENSDTHLFFVGVSNEFHETEKAARNAAFLDSLEKFSLYCGVKIDTLLTIMSQETDNNVMTDSSIFIEDRDKQQSSAFVSNFRDKDWCILKTKLSLPDRNLKESWKAYVLSSVPRKDKEKVNNVLTKPEKTKMINNYPIKSEHLNTKSETKPQHDEQLFFLRKPESETNDNNNHTKQHYKIKQNEINIDESKETFQKKWR